jgi:hypothetical protein
MLAREKWMVKTIAVLEKVFDERVRQVARYGHNDDLDDGTGSEAEWLQPLSDFPARTIEYELREEYENHEMVHGKPTWMHLVREEIAESFAEDDPERLTAELLQVAALCVSWVETIEKRV